MIKYAGYIIHNKINRMANNFDPIKLRTYIAAQLFKHGCGKQIEDYETDFNLLPHSVRMDMKMKVSL